MTEFIPGQRWVNNAELQLGLGTVLSCERRTVTIRFQAIGETRTYARQSAPLTRVRFSAGDMIQDSQGNSLQVNVVKESNGLLTYSGQDRDGNSIELAETQLNNFIQLNRPTERLLSGQIDQDKWFELRYQTLQHLNELTHSDLRGLTGCRTSLIPHQLYIVHEVANRYAPRVLLADEVGLGKTIEAGLIIHQQLLTERIRRVLIIVPETLVHQWLVEMLRRFNLHFSIFNDDRYAGVTDNKDAGNPFHAQQLALCSLKFLQERQDSFRDALAGAWDLLVVDEAHHLQWSPGAASDEYKIIEQLAQHTPGVLLLTATPEQLGKTGHFARLRLLDPDRFHDYDAFIAEQQSYEPVAEAVAALLSNQPPGADTISLIKATIAEGDNETLLKTLQQTGSKQLQNQRARQELVEHLLDRHGTGRILFRNTRETVKGFPARQVYSHPLDLPADYVSLAKHKIDLLQQLLTPEILFQSHHQGPGSWTQIDPRVSWLAGQLRDLKPAKVLVIAALAQTALDLSQALKIREGINAAVFHEGMSIIERDRAAAYFADPEAGAQILICSEIGSEGRNFQFAHHLVLFDLPLNPDLLEQRIGRLDRIGQSDIVHIHIPYLENSAQAVMHRWYREGLNAFAQPCPAGHEVFVQVEQKLNVAMQQIDGNLDELIETTRKLHAELDDALHRGRDRLLEYNSCRPAIANSIMQRALQQDADSTLPRLMESMFDCFGIHTESHISDCYIIRPGEDMLMPFPGLPDDGLTITYDRATALANEDIHYITRDHPLVITAMDIVLSSELGNTAVTAIENSGLTAGMVLLESLYLLECPSSDALQTNRYLPAATIRVVVDEKGNDQTAAVAHEFINTNKSSVAKDTANKIIHLKQGEIKTMIAAGGQHAVKQSPQLLTSAHEQAKQTLMTEINRLKALRRVNPNVREDEIQFFQNQLLALDKAIDTASLRLDALRVLITT